MWLHELCCRDAGSKPKQGTNEGVELSLSASEPGGTCLIFFSLVPPRPLPLHRVLRTFARLFLPPATPEKIRNRIDDEAL